jgi:hypothetical protein
MKKHLLLIALHLAANGADAFYTHRNATAYARPFRFHEGDPIARPFVTHGTAGLAAYFSASSALTLGADYLLRKHHHDALAAALLGAQTVNNGVSAAYSAAHYKEGK